VDRIEAVRGHLQRVRLEEVVRVVGLRLDVDTEHVESGAVVATRGAGPPEIDPPGAGVLVDPLDEEAIAAALAEAAALPRPNEAARAAAAEHDVNRQAERIEAILERAAG
jgi:glycosyltransferase involved in cell wall biosynthesis